MQRQPNRVPAQADQRPWPPCLWCAARAAVGPAARGTYDPCDGVVRRCPTVVTLREGVRMTGPNVLDSRAVLPALRRAVVRAVRAPSVHNTQPWRFVLEPASLRMREDRSRRLRVLDPAGRQM